MNNDRFKFRIWDNKTKQYLNTADLYIDSNGIIHAHKFVWGEYKNANENLIVEQCTGLKDASGIPCSILCNCEKEHLCFKSPECEDFTPRKSKKPRVRYY